MKINVISCAPYDITREGKQYKGYNCDAVKENNNVFRFSTSVDRTKDIVDVDDYDPELAIDVPIVMSVFDGKRKYRETVEL